MGRRALGWGLIRWGLLLLQALLLQATRAGQVRAWFTVGTVVLFRSARCFTCSVCRGCWRFWAAESWGGSSLAGACCCCCGRCCCKLRWQARYGSWLHSRTSCARRKSCSSCSPLVSLVCCQPCMRCSVHCSRPYICSNHEPPAPPDCFRPWLLCCSGQPLAIFLPLPILHLSSPGHDAVQMLQLLTPVMLVCFVLYVLPQWAAPRRLFLAAHLSLGV